MVKLSLNSIKYVIEGKFQVNGFIDKNDFIGSLYGQTEGLIGDDLDFNNLLKKGKIGRIEIILSKRNSKSHGKFSIPTYLDKTEVALVAAAIESVTKIGHCEGKIQIVNIQDVRDEKRKQVLSRAEEFLKQLKESSPESKKISEKVVDKYSTQNIKTYAGNKISAGPDAKDSKELILVEGRADVINLVKNGYKNVISFNGSNIPAFFYKLCENKELTLFLDGDDAGKKEFEFLKDKLKPKFYVFAPTGKEVEELNLKEIDKALKNKKELNNTTGIIKKFQKAIKEEKNYRDVKKNLSYITRKEFYDLKKIVLKSIQNNSYIILNNKFLIKKEDNIQKFFDIKNSTGNILVYNGLCEGKVLKKSKELNIEFILCKKASKFAKDNGKIKLFEEFLN